MYSGRLDSPPQGCSPRTAEPASEAPLDFEPLDTTRELPPTSATQALPDGEQCRPSDGTDQAKTLDITVPPLYAARSQDPNVTRPPAYARHGRGTAIAMHPSCAGCSGDPNAMVPPAYGERSKPLNVTLPPT